MKRIAAISAFAGVSSIMILEVGCSIVEQRDEPVHRDICRIQQLSGVRWSASHGPTAMRYYKAYYNQGKEEIRIRYDWLNRPWYVRVFDTRPNIDESLNRMEVASMAQVRRT
jgi:hypothetical protein